MSEASGTDRRWLDAAARLARAALGASPGHSTAAAIIVDEELQLVFGRGVTGRAVPFAEPYAIDEARGSARGRTLYSTLEPTAEWGRTPPSTEAIIKSGLGRVVVGTLHPDRLQAGQGVARLREAGLVVDVFDHRHSAELYEPERMSFRKGRPYVTGKLVVSKDGAIGLPTQRHAVIGGEQTQRWVQMLRATTDAVMIGARAAEIDDPKLFVRIKGLDGRVYQRVVVVGTRELNTDLNLVAGVSGYPTAILAASGREFEVPDVVDVIVVDGRNNRPDLRKSMEALTSRGIVNLLVEGGARLIEAFIAAELLDRFHLVTTDQVVGRGGIPATMLGGLDGRLRGAGFVEVDRRQMGADKLRTFEREL